MILFVLYPPCRDEESIDTHRRSRLKRYRGLPPLTPNAAVKDTVCHLVFDQIWNETVAVLQPLVALIRERASQGMYVHVSQFCVLPMQRTVCPMIH